MAALTSAENARLIYAPAEPTANRGLRMLAWKVLEPRRDVSARQAAHDR